jgi:hypothetical protein
MDTAILWLSLILFLIVVSGALRTVLERRWPFLRKFDEARQAYIVLAIVAVGLFAWVHLGKDVQIKSIEIAGVKAEVGELKQRVASLSEQMELFFKSKKIEVFNRSNWSRIRTVEKSGRKIILEVTLEWEPIPNSIEVFEGVLLMPEQDYRVEGRVVRFPANTDTPTDGLTIKYYPRVPSSERTVH